MAHTEQWIWLPQEIYPDNQLTNLSGFEDKSKGNFTVAEFKKELSFTKKIVKAELRFSADTSFQLYCNGECIATGPACVGGDFIGNENARENFYAFETVIRPCSAELNLFARVKMCPVQICEYSKGHGGFMLSAIITFEDGTKESICTDESWLVRKNNSYNSDSSFDGRIKPTEYTYAQIITNIWCTSTAPIPVRVENEIFCENSDIELLPYEKKEVILNLDKIWSGFIHARMKSQGEVRIKITCREINEETEAEDIYLTHNDQYRSFCMRSAGNVVVIAENCSDKKINTSVSFISTHYPVYDDAFTITDDEDLNAVIKTCKHTLKICRQTHHLDSPRHCEPLACTGDYYIETLMTPFSFGDMRLSEFDIIRTAIMLERENGRMFHTTYSLIWVRMLYDVYMLTGNLDLLKRCEKALRLLLRRFSTYIGESGLIENPPDYMFIDWIYIDEISMHHPPKALGQTCLNMFYFGALDFSEKIFKELGYEGDAVNYAAKREILREKINTLLFDEERRLYFMGLNTPEKADEEWKWMPENTSKRYYLKHANILAAYFGVCNDDLGRELLTKVMDNEIEGDCQPYFLHYLLEAIYRLGMRENYTLHVISKWKKPVRECSKGLVEGFIPPEPTYAFDHSHAWGGTPLYSLPKALLGLEILSPGMKKIKLSPSLLGLGYAKAELLTPYGKVTCEMNEGKEPIIKYPDGVDITIK